MRDSGITHEFECVKEFCSDFMGKINTWIQKRKYKCAQVSEDEVKVKIGGLFEFTAKRKAESDQIFGV